MVEVQGVYDINRSIIVASIMMVMKVRVTLKGA
jgi:hypothetical protein